MRNPTTAVTRTATIWTWIQTTIVSRVRDLGERDGRLKFRTRFKVVHVCAATSNRAAVSTSTGVLYKLRDSMIYLQYFATLFKIPVRTL